MKTFGALGVVGLAGCLSNGGSDGSGGEESDIPTEEDGVEFWGERLNDHAREADIDWRQFEGTELTFGMGLHKYSVVTQPLLDYFEDLTGIDVTYDIHAEDEYWLAAEHDLENVGEYDGVMTGLWQAAEMHENGWIHDLNQFIDDPSLTDPGWLQMDDFLDQTIELMTFPDDDFVGFPNGIEAYGCVGLHEPTFEELSLDEPTNFEELEECAQAISESDLDREGIVSRTSTTTLSSANWGTMFKSHGADWIDRDSREARLDSPEGIESLERFGGMLNQYGPEDPGTYDWYSSNGALSEGDVGILYSTPSTSGVIDEAVHEETKWLPPLQAQGGPDPVANTWVWATGISQQSDNPEAAWLFVQWANSRLANFVLSTKQWQGHHPRAGFARLNYVADVYRGDEEIAPDEDIEIESHGITDSFLEAHEQGMAMVPSDPPPVPVDTPMNMPIMSEAAVAMNRVVRGEATAEQALSDAAPQITEYARQIPDDYLE